MEPASVAVTAATDCVVADTSSSAEKAIESVELWGATVSVTCYTPISGIYAASKLSSSSNHQQYSINIHNVDTCELAVLIKVINERPLRWSPGPGGAHDKYIFTDEAATKLVFTGRYQAGYKSSVWSLSSLEFLHSFPCKWCSTVLMSANGAKLFYDCESQHGFHEAIRVANADTGGVLWSTILDSDGNNIDRNSKLMACFSANDTHVAVLFVSSVETATYNYLDQINVRFYNAASGVIENSVDVCPFSVNTMRAGFAEYAIILGGKRAQHPGVLLVGTDLVSTRIILLPMSSLPGTQTIHTHIGSPGVAVMTMLNNAVAAVVAYNLDSNDTEAVTNNDKLCNITLPSPYSWYGFYNFYAHSHSNRFASCVGDSTAANMLHIFDIHTGALLNTFRAPERMLNVGGHWRIMHSPIIYFQFIFFCIYLLYLCNNNTRGHERTTVDDIYKLSAVIEETLSAVGDYIVYVVKKFLDKL
jgi:hypothetical protein